VGRDREAARRKRGRPCQQSKPGRARTAQRRRHPTLFATLEAVKGQPELAKFQFRATNRWIRGTNSRSRIEPFKGAGGVHAHKGVHEYDADHPAVLVGGDQAAHAGRVPAARDRGLHHLRHRQHRGRARRHADRGDSTVEGDIDLLGILGLSDQVRNGYQKIRVSFDIKGDAPPEKLRQIVEQSRARSAVYDVLSNGVPVEITVNAA
jgi:hypothetical protein